jgi:hypothetical protein
MGKRGDGYGSEYHLRRYLSEREQELSTAVRAAVGAPSSRCEWLPFPSVDGVERELKGVEFLAANAAGRQGWKGFWPSTGNAQNWDAVGRISVDDEAEWVLVEAKARAAELVSPACAAKGDGRTMIESALRDARRHFGVPEERDWMGTYYQIANRLASLYFLNEVAGERARLVFLYFTSDRFPDGSACPASETEWEPLINRAKAALGLPMEIDRVHHVFLPALPKM